MNIETIERGLDLLGERLQLLEQTLQTRITLENMTVERHREEHQKRTASAFNSLSIMIGMLVIFEVIAAFISFYFRPDSPFVWILWALTLFCPPALILIFLSRISKSLSTSTNEE